MSYSLYLNRADMTVCLLLMLAVAVGVGVETKPLSDLKASILKQLYAALLSFAFEIAKKNTDPLELTCEPTTFPNNCIS